MNATKSPVVKVPEKMEGVKLALAVLREVLAFPEYQSDADTSVGPRRPWLWWRHEEGVSLTGPDKYWINVGFFSPGEPRAVALVKETIRQRGFLWNTWDSENGLSAARLRLASNPFSYVTVSGAKDEGTAVFRCAIVVARAQKGVGGGMED